MKFVTTTAIVLRSINFSDSDKIFSLLTPDLGRISAIAKGVRKIKSRKSGHLDLGNVVKVSLVEGKKMYVLTQAEIIFSPARNGLEITAAIFECLEILCKITHDGPDSRVFYLLYITFLNEVQIDKMNETGLKNLYLGVLKSSGFWQETLMGYNLFSLRNYFENITDTQINSRFLQS